MSGLRTLSVFLVAAIALSGCMTPPDKATTIAQPKTPVTRTVTSFTEAKRCMDRLFATYDKGGYVIATDGLTDDTQSVSVGTQGMIMNAISDMSLESRAFEIFTHETTPGMIYSIQREYSPLARYRGEIPTYYIRGSISQADNSIANDDRSAGLATPFFRLGGGKEQDISIIAIDMQLAQTTNRRVVPGVTSSNTITVTGSGSSGDSQGLINSGDVRGSLKVSFFSQTREGRGQAVRTLLEYSLIELLGKFTNVPYQRCLELPSTDPSSMQVARERYDDLDPAARTKSVQLALSALGEYGGPADGVMSYELQEAVTRAKAKRDLVPNGRIDFQLFNALYNENALPTTVVAKPEFNPATDLPPSDNLTDMAGRDPIGLDLSLEHPHLGKGDPVVLRLAVGRPARVYCYYEYIERGEKKTARIMPNRYHHDNLVMPGTPLIFPQPEDNFEIILGSDAEEAVACVATTFEYTMDERPVVLEQPDLQPIAGEWAGIDYPVYNHQEFDRVQTTAQVIRFRARP